MALSAQRILERSEQARASRQQESKLPIFKPEANKQKIDSFLQNRVFFGYDGTPEAESYMIPLRFHHKIFEDQGTERHPLCNQVFGKRCAPCVYAKKLRAAGKEDEAREVEAKDCFLAQVLVMPLKPKEGSLKLINDPANFSPMWKLFYMTGKQLDAVNNLMQEAQDDFETDFCDPKTGMLIEFQAKNFGMQRRYDYWKLVPKSGRGIQEIFGLSDAKYKELMGSVIDLTKVHPKGEKQEALAAILGISWEGDDEEDEEEDAPPVVQKKASAEKPSAEKPSKKKPAPVKDEEEDDEEEEAAPPPKKKPAPAKPPVEEDEEDDEEEKAPPPKKKKPAPVKDEEEDDEEEDEEDEVPQKPAVKKKPAPVKDEEEEDDDEEEEEAAPPPKKKKPAPVKDEEEEEDEEVVTPEEIVRRAKQKAAERKAKAVEAEDEAPPPPKKPGKKKPTPVEDDDE